jgi:hypothetical protein
MLLIIFLISSLLSLYYLNEYIDYGNHMRLTYSISISVASALIPLAIAGHYIEQQKHLQAMIISTLLIVPIVFISFTANYIGNNQLTRQYSPKANKSTIPLDPRYQNPREKEYQASLVLRRIESMIKQYYVANGCYPEDSNSFMSLKAREELINLPLPYDISIEIGDTSHSITAIPTDDHFYPLVLENSTITIKYDQ